jgi:hypothetical protein
VRQISGADQFSVTRDCCAHMLCDDRWIQADGINPRNIRLGQYDTNRFFTMVFHRLLRTARRLESFVRS